MSTERSRMLAGEPYDPADPELAAARRRARTLCRALDAADPGDDATRRLLCRQIFAAGGETVWLEPPFRCDYGANIELGERVFFNFNCVVLDVCRVRIGAYAFFGPGVQVLTALHPMNAAERRRHEYGRPVEIGADVWVGAAALVLPGVRIGAGTVIGAGSVVTRDVPEGVLAAGNPCRILRPLTAAERAAE
jgi:maltose O-acetyltransferase